jgi:hypothetical protein
MIIILAIILTAVLLVVLALGVGALNLAADALADRRDAKKTLKPTVIPTDQNIHP